jgi:hypothetical protein
MIWQPRSLLTAAFLALILGASACGSDPAPLSDSVPLHDIVTPDGVTALDSTHLPPATDTLSPPADTQSPEDTYQDTQPPAPYNCLDYCSAVEKNCVGDFAQYPSKDACVSLCQNAGWPLGTLVDANTNTLGCRLGLAEKVTEVNAVAFCPYAGLSGGGHCGSWCDNYCHYATYHCTGEASLFDNLADCQSACEAVDASGGPGDVSGDTIQCRINMLGTAMGEQAGPLCANGAIEDSAACGDTEPSCQLYCDTIQASCPADSQVAQYASHEGCMSTCQSKLNWPLGAQEDNASNTVACRLSEAIKANFSPELYCDSAGPGGNNVCGNWCQNYCATEQAICSGVNPLFDDFNQCLFACTNIADDGEWGDSYGDTLQCRLGLLVKAALQPNADVATLCAHAAPQATETCSEPLPPPNCGEYCDLVGQACGWDDGSLSPFPNKEACMGFCGLSLLTPGTGSDDGVNSLGCRHHYAQMALASNNAALSYCPKAGPSGGGACGTKCEVYCGYIMAKCTQDNALYPDAETCAQTCAAIPPGGDESDVSQDTVQCRIHHLITGITGTLETLAEGCKSNASLQSPTCRDEPPTCETYCHITQLSCGDGSKSPAQYIDQDACLSFCKNSGIPMGSAEDLANHTIGCRTNLAKIAFTSPEEGCEGAGPSGGQVCGTPCEIYCQQGQAACSGVVPFFDDNENCLATCAGYPTGGAQGDLYGDTIQCRLTHVTKASLDGEDANQHCAQATPEGGTDCTLTGGPPAVTYVEHVQPILANHCVPCHQGDEPGTCSGGACFASSYTDLTQPSYYCPGEKKGACIVTRILDGSMPINSPGAVGEDEIGTLQQWLTDGMQQE